MSDIVIKIKGEAADLKSSMDESANAVRDGASRMSESLSGFAASAASKSEAVAGHLDGLAEASAAAAAGFAALGQEEIAAPLTAAAAAAEATATSLRVVGYGASAVTEALGRSSASAREQAASSEEMAVANQQAGSSWGAWVAGGVAVAALAAAAYVVVSSAREARDAVTGAASAVADWAGEVSGATAIAAMFSEQAQAQAEAVRLLTLQFGDQAQSFTHIAEASRDYGVSNEEAAGAISRMIDILNPANQQFEEQRKILEAYGVSSKDAATALDQFAHALSGVRDGSAKTADAIAVLGTGAPHWLKGIADGAGNVSHAFNEADRVVSVVAADIQASNEKIAHGPHVSWTGQLGDQLRDIGDRFDKMTTRSDEFKSKQEYALSHVSIAWREYKADVASLGDVWDSLKKSASEYFALVKDGGAEFKVPEKQGDNRPDAPTQRPKQAQSFTQDEVSSGAQGDLANYEKQLQAKKLLKENWLREDRGLEVEFWQNSIADAKANEVEENSVLMGLLQTRLAESERAEAQYQNGRAKTESQAAQQAADAEKAAQLRSLQMMTDAAQKGSLDRIHAAGDEVAYAFKAWGGMSSQYKSTMERLLAADHEYEQQQQEISKIRTNADQEVARIGLQTERDRLDAEVSEGKISVSQKIAALKTLTQAANDEALKRLDAEIATLHQGNKEWEEAMAKRRILVAQQNADKAKLDTEAVVASKKAAQDNEKAWETSFQPINRAFSTSINGIIQGTTTLRQAEAKAAQSVLLSWVDASEQSASKWIASQFAKLTATESADAGMAASGAASQAAQDTTQSQGILKHAGAAAAAVYDDVAQIPYVGWILAPPAAAAAFAAVAAFSAAGGMGDVPYDNAPFLLHKQEMVLPANIANPLRNMLSGASVGGYGMPALGFAGSGDASAALGANIGGGSSAGRETHHHYHASFPTSIHNNGGALSKDDICDAVANGYRDGHSKLIKNSRKYG